MTFQDDAKLLRIVAEDRQDIAEELEVIATKLDALPEILDELEKLRARTEGVRADYDALVAGAKRIKVVGLPPQRIKVVDKTQPRIDPDKVAAALGAERKK